MDVEVGFKVMRIDGSRSVAVSRIYQVREAAEQLRLLHERQYPEHRFFVTTVNRRPRDRSALLMEG